MKYVLYMYTFLFPSRAEHRTLLENKNITTLAFIVTLKWNTLTPLSKKKKKWPIITYVWCIM